jgi:hypothetical protein
MEATMVDRYTKTMLTVIAVCLVWLSVLDVVVDALHAADVTHVVVDNQVPVPVVIGYAGASANLRVTEEHGLPVKIINK